MALLKVWDGSQWVVVANANGVAAVLDDLSDVTLTAAANDDLLQRKSGVWVNRSLAQVTADLIVDAAFIEGIEDRIGSSIVQGAGITVAYNDTTGKTTITRDTIVLPSLNIRTEDGTVSDGNVNTFKVPNGYLIDNGVGNVSLTFPTTLPYALPVGLAGSDVVNATSNTLPAAGGAVLVPVAVTAPLVLESVSIYSRDTSAARSWEWRLYREPVAGGATLDEVAGANGSESFTAAAISVRTAAATSVVTLAPGLYWLAIRCSHATSTFALGVLSLPAGAATFGLNSAQTKTISALASTIDATTSWSKVATILVGARLNGRVFGQGARW